ncbi:MAG: internal scaffolding protein [Microvirus sp.]|nr:MAG: internal scaffolding protein [Microvirus sp.]
MIPFVRSPYNYDMNEAGDESGLLCLDKSLAVQDQRDEVDINTIIRRFGLSGELPDVVRLPQYGDFNGISDYREALEAVNAAENAFMELPAEMRSRFHNDVQALLEFCSNPDNAGELERLGLTKVKPVDPGPVKVEVVTPKA